MKSSMKWRWLNNQGAGMESQARGIGNPTWIQTACGRDGGVGETRDHHTIAFEPALSAGLANQNGSELVTEFEQGKTKCSFIWMFCNAINWNHSRQLDCSFEDCRTR